MQNKRYKWHEDPVQSILLLLEVQGVNIVCRPIANYDCIGILIPIFHDVMAAPGRSSEIFVDSTCEKQHTPENSDL